MKLSTKPNPTIGIAVIVKRFRSFYAHVGKGRGQCGKEEADNNNNNNNNNGRQPSTVRAGHGRSRLSCCNRWPG